MEPNDRPIRVVVCDAGPIIHLDELECIHLLEEFAEIIIPSTVWNEIARHRENVLNIKCIRFRKVEAESAGLTEIESLSKMLALHAGERDALVVAREFQAGLLLTDDSAARLASGILGIPVHGTIGILFRAIRRGEKSAKEIATILRAIPEKSTLYIKRDLLEEFIRRADRER